MLSYESSGWTLVIRPAVAHREPLSSPKKGQSRTLAPKGHNGRACSTPRQRHKSVFLSFAKESVKLVIFLMGETQRKWVSRRMSYEMQTKIFVSFANTVVVHGESQVYKKSGAGDQSDLALLDNSSLMTPSDLVIKRAPRARRLSSTPRLQLRGHKWEMPVVGLAYIFGPLS